MAYFELRTAQTYVQGPDALLELKRYVHHLGSNYLIVTGCGPVTGLVMEKVKKSFESTMVEILNPGNYRLSQARYMAESYDRENRPIRYEFLDMEGKQVSTENIDYVRETAEKQGADVIIGIGGGKALDLARAVSLQLGLEVALCPTSVATNAPASALAVRYNDAGEIQQVYQMHHFPRLVLSDLSLIVKAPAITLAAGIGDCMGTHYESLQRISEANWQNKHIDGVMRATNAQREIFYKNGYPAYVANQAGMITPAFESVVAQINHKPGPETQTSGTHMAHLVDEIFLYFEQSKNILHGLLVGYGVIPTLVYGNYPMEDIYRYVDFCRSIHIPVTLDELGVANQPKEKFAEIAKLVVNGPQNAIYPANITADDLYQSVLMAQQIVTDYLAR